MTAPLIGLVAAVASSLCCVAPVLAALAGAGSLAGSFHWLGPARPWLLGFAALALGYAWWLKLRPAPADACGCDVPAKKHFFQRTGFLVAISLFAIATSAFPLYARLFERTPTPVTVDAQTPVQRVVIGVKGMTCEGCEPHVSGVLSAVPGVRTAMASYVEGSATIEFDPDRTTLPALIAAIDSTGYSAWVGHRGEQPAIR